ncbi:MAG TPA: carboxypeptidase-like regulatory domain-containing protein, partial [Dehalococcoidia bacterium]|nr:carboxypeptidase-like regulatory domain-containing protein [Dehalococcoidia bacterium]
VNFALQAVVATPSATGSLIGQVVNVANGQPVTEAVALLRERMPLPILSTLTEEMVAQTTTDAAGNYSFTGLEPGIYRLRVQAEGFHKVTVDNIAILAGQTSVVNVALRPKEAQQPHGAITGRVTDKATGEAVGDAVVFFTPSHGADKDGHDGRFANINDQGNYVLENVPAGVYAIHVEAKGYKPAKVEGVTVKASEQTTVNVTLEAVPGRGRREDNGNDEHETNAKDNSGHGKKNQGNENSEQKGRGHGKLDGSISLQSDLTTEHSLVFPDIQTAFDQ